MQEFKGKTRVLAYLVVVSACLMILFPFVYIFITSLKKQIDIYMGSLIFTPTLYNYDRLLFSKQANFLLNIKNTALVAVVSTLVVMTVGTLAAYALTRFKWSAWVSWILLGWILIFHMIPPITLVGPWYLIFRRLGLYNTLSGLQLTHITLNLPMAVWLMMSYLQDVPKELEEAAWIDGCSRIASFFRVVVPLVVPGLMATGILSFIFSWNEFSVALNLTTSSTATVPVAIAKFAQQYEIRHGEMAAAAVLATIPAIVLMFFGQRYIVKGLTLGALK
ncbi:MAG: carbohydrate ABC transporter permease [Anaerolineae bacterium]